MTLEALRRDTAKMRTSSNQWPQGFSSFERLESGNRPPGRVLRTEARTSTNCSPQPCHAVVAEYRSHTQIRSLLAPVDVGDVVRAGVVLWQRWASMSFCISGQTDGPWFLQSLFSLPPIVPIPVNYLFSFIMLRVFIIAFVSVFALLVQARESTPTTDTKKATPNSSLYYSPQAPLM